MDWKSKLAVFTIIGIGVLLLQTDSGRDYFNSSMNLLRVKAGNAVATTVSGLFKQSMPEGQPYKIELESNREAFAGQSYPIGNSSFEVNGKCVTSIRIDNIYLEKELTDCNIKSDSLKGDFGYTESGTVTFDGTAEKIQVDEQLYKTRSSETVMDNSLDVKFEVIPENMILKSLELPKIELESVNGIIKRYNENDELKGDEHLDSDMLEIRGFEGYLKVENSNIIKLNGDAVSVEGGSGDLSFKW